MIFVVGELRHLVKMLDSYHGTYEFVAGALSNQD